MFTADRTPQQEWEIIDLAMKAIAGACETKGTVSVHLEGANELVSTNDFVAELRRHTSPLFAT